MFTQQKIVITVIFLLLSSGLLAKKNIAVMDFSSEVHNNQRANRGNTPQSQWDDIFVA